VDEPLEPTRQWTRASFVQRFGAFLVDRILLSLTATILQSIFFATAERTQEGLTFSPRQLVIGFALDLIYFTIFEGSESGQTLGKRLLRIRVVDFGTGERIDYRRALARAIGKILSGIPFGLGYLWMLWDRDGQTWHDKFAYSTVANAPRVVEHE
jgi:uncharacterized RDD family membrane protein YckC